MAKQELLDYIKKASDLGKTRAEIEQSLLGVGWKGDDVAEAIGILEGVKQNTLESSHKTKKIGLKNILPIILVFVLGLGAGLSLIFFMPKNQVVQNKQVTGFEAQKTNDGQRIADLLKIQKALEEYYVQTKNYPDNLDQLGNIPKNPSGGNYSYVSVGSPVQSYTLSAQLENSEDGSLQIKDGFLTLKNQQGKK